MVILRYLGFDSARTCCAESQEAPSRNNPRKNAPFSGPNVFAFSHSAAFRTRKLNSACKEKFVNSSIQTSKILFSPADVTIEMAAKIPPLRAFNKEKVEV